MLGVIAVSTSSVTIGIAIVGLAMVSGFFWGWWFSALRGLGAVDDRTYVTTMRSVNRAILNPIFLGVFVGTVVALLAAAVTTFAAGDTKRAWWVTAGGAAYVVGVFAVTAAGNVPLNDRLEAFEPAGADDGSYTLARQAYEEPWNRLHRIRSVLGIVAITCATIAALTPADG